MLPVSTACRNHAHDDCLKYALKSEQAGDEWDPTQLTKCGCQCHGRTLRSVKVNDCEYIYVIDEDDEKLGDPFSEDSINLAKFIEETIRRNLNDPGVATSPESYSQWNFTFLWPPAAHRMRYNPPKPIRTAEDYQAEGSKTAGHYDTRKDLLIFAQNGMTGELGEFANHISKTYFQGHPYNREGMIEELGDLLWFACRAMDALDVGIIEVMNANIIKLRKRYAGGVFTPEASIARIDVETTPGKTNHS